jgi:hypothetical protein
MSRPDAECILLFSHRAKSARDPPARDPPAIFLPEYTRVQMYFVDDSNKGKRYNFTFSASDFERLIAHARRAFSQTGAARLRETDRWLAVAVGQYFPPHAERVLILGSGSQPWHEAWLLSQFPHLNIDSVDYHTITLKHPQIQTYTTENWYVTRSTSFTPLYDSVFAILSIEHDGLGRYGDSIDHAADLVTMQRLRCVLKPGGLLFLAVAIGREDVLVWNLRRQYGAVRLTRLLAGWRTAERFGWDDDRRQRHVDASSTYAPVFVLTPDMPVERDL